MSLQFTKAGTSDAFVLNAISKLAFDSDVDVGAPAAGGPPGYMSLKYHMKMARSGHLYKIDRERPDHWRGHPFSGRGYAEYRQDICESGSSSKRLRNTNDAGN